VFDYFSRSFTRFAIITSAGNGHIVGNNAGIEANPMKPLYVSAPFLVRAGTVPGSIA